MRISRSRASGTALLTLAAAGALTTALLTPIGASADDSTTTEDPCKDFPALSDADRRAGNCVPGNDIARMNDRGTKLDTEDDEQSSRNVRRLKTIPKQGSFASLDALNSDLAFSGRYAYAGNYNGLHRVRPEEPAKPKVLSQVVCPGSQNDISVYGDLLVLSTDSSRSDDSCESTAQSATIKDSWEGIKVFDISNPRVPEYVSAVETRAARTPTRSPPRRARAAGATTRRAAGTQGRGPLRLRLVLLAERQVPRLPASAGLVGVVKIPTDKPEKAALVDVPVLFPDGGNPATATPAPRPAATT